MEQFVLEPKFRMNLISYVTISKRVNMKKHNFTYNFTHFMIYFLAVLAAGTVIYKVQQAKAYESVIIKRDFQKKQDELDRLENESLQIELIDYSDEPFEHEFHLCSEDNKIKNKIIL